MVLPVPGGPHRISDGSSFASSARRSSLPGPSRCSWPTNSASDAAASARPAAARGDPWPPCARTGPRCQSNRDAAGGQARTSGLVLWRSVARRLRPEGLTRRRSARVLGSVACSMPHPYRDGPRVRPADADTVAARRPRRSRPRRRGGSAHAGPTPPNPTPPPAPTEVEGAAVEDRPAPAARHDAAPRSVGRSAEAAEGCRRSGANGSRAQLDEVFGGQALAKAKVSAIVVDADTGKTIYARDEKTQLNAASNVKIVTVRGRPGAARPRVSLANDAVDRRAARRPAAARGRRGRRRSLPARLRRSDAGRPKTWRRWSATWPRWACARCAARWSSTTACSKAATSRPPTIRRTIRPRRARPRRRRR